MSVIKQISVYQGTQNGWETADIGANASNITLSSNLAGSTNLQTALNNILPANSKLGNSKVVLTDTNGKLSTPVDVSSSQLGYLSGVTDNIQTQINTLNTNLSKVTPRKGTLSSGTDLNTLFGLEHLGQYSISGSYTYSNLPTGFTWGTLEVQSGGSFTIQRFTTSSGTTFTRIYANDAWSSWGRLTSNSYVADNYVAKTGDTMTGILTIQQSTSKHKIDCISENIIVGQTPSSHQQGGQLWMYGKDSKAIGSVRTLQSSADGRMQLRLEAYNRANTTTTDYSQNYVLLSVLKDGTKEVTVSDPEAWRSAISAVPTSRTVNSKALSSNITLSASDVSAAPTSHTSTATTYGAGSTANYGHVKVVDSLNTSSAVTGLALSARQGYLLNNKITTINNKFSAKIIRATSGTYSLGNYKTTGTTTAGGRINLSESFKNYSTLIIRVGADTDDAGGGGAHYFYFPSNIITTGSSAANMACPFNLNKKSYHLDVQALTTTSLQIKHAYNLTDGSTTLTYGIRQVYGMY